MAEESKTTSPAIGEGRDNILIENQTGACAEARLADVEIGRKPLGVRQKLNSGRILLPCRQSLSHKHHQRQLRLGIFAIPENGICVALLVDAADETRRPREIARNLADFADLTRIALFQSVVGQSLQLIQIGKRIDDPLPLAFVETGQSRREIDGLRRSGQQKRAQARYEQEGPGCSPRVAGERINCRGYRMRAGGSAGAAPRRKPMSTRVSSCHPRALP